MISKKDAVTLGMLAIGGVGAAMIVGGGGGGDGGAAVEGKKGGILGSQQGYGAPTVYNLPAAAQVSFPEAPKFDIGKFFAPQAEPFAEPQVVSRGAAGVSAAPKPKKVTPYLYTGGEVKAGAVSVAPWAMGVSTPAEIGVTTAFKRASSGTAPIAKKQPVSSGGGGSYRTGARRTSVTGKYSGR
jgi:hypothetical protein